MALVVESTSTITGAGVDTLTITKPTGVQVGDLLLIIGGGPALGSYLTSTGFSPAFQSDYDGGGSNPDSTLTVLYKIATSGDVAASNYVIDYPDTTSLGIATMFRVSGWTSGNPVFGSSVSQSVEDSSTPTMGATGLSLTRASGQLLIAVGFCHSNNSPFTIATFSGYSVTSGVANPSWTEVIDTNVSIYGSSNVCSLGVAYANTTDTSNITAWGITVSAGTGGNADNYHGALIQLSEPNSVSGTNALLSVSPSFFPNTAVEVGTIGTNALHAVSPTFFDQNGIGTSPAIRVNPDKPSTDWVNTDK